MKWILAIALAAMFALADALAGAKFNPGETGELSDGAIIKGVVVASTNATQTAKVKAVYSWPIWGEATDSTVTTISYTVPVDRVDTLTNWCDYATANAVTNITEGGSVTNVVYYDGITVATNRVLSVVEKPVTNTVTRAVIVGRVSVTNQLYSITASGGVGSSTNRVLVGAGARLLIEDAPVTIFWE